MKRPGDYSPTRSDGPIKWRESLFPAYRQRQKSSRRSHVFPLKLQKRLTASSWFRGDRSRPEGGATILSVVIHNIILMTRGVRTLPNLTGHHIRTWRCNKYYVILERETKSSRIVIINVRATIKIKKKLPYYNDYNHIMYYVLMLLRKRVIPLDWVSNHYWCVALTIAKITYHSPVALELQ